MPLHVSSSKCSSSGEPKECIKLVITQNRIKMHGQQNIKKFTGIFWKKCTVQDVGIPVSQHTSYCISDSLTVRDCDFQQSLCKNFRASLRKMAAKTEP
jgi:hypothetical protein